METIEQKQTRHIAVWAFIGPLLSLTLLFLIFFKQVHTPLLLVAIVVGGTAASWLFRLRGLFLSLLALSVLLALEWSASSFQEKYWLFGLSFSAAMTFVITALSFEEIDEILFSTEREEEGRFQQTKNLAEELEKKEEEWEKEESKLKADVAWHKETIGKKEKEMRSLQDQLKASQSEMHLARIQKEEIGRDLAKKEQGLKELQTLLEKEKALWEANCEELMKKLGEQAPPPDSYEPLYKQLKQQFADKGTLLDETRKELFTAQETVARLEKELGKATHTSVSQEVFDRPPDSYEPLYKQLKQQFADKGTLLDETRKELFTAQETVTRLEKELGEATHTSVSQEVFDHHLFQMEEELVAYKEEIASLQALLDTFISPKG